MRARFGPFFLFAHFRLNWIILCDETQTKNINQNRIEKRAHATHSMDFCWVVGLFSNEQDDASCWHQIKFGTISPNSQTPKTFQFFVCLSVNRVFFCVPVVICFISIPPIRLIKFIIIVIIISFVYIIIERTRDICRTRYNNKMLPSAPQLPCFAPTGLQSRVLFGSNNFFPILKCRQSFKIWEQDKKTNDNCVLLLVCLSPSNHLLSSR